jgi:hypothetical protein
MILVLEEVRRWPRPLYQLRAVFRPRPRLAPAKREMDGIGKSPLCRAAVASLCFGDLRLIYAVAWTQRRLAFDRRRLDAASMGTEAVGSSVPLRLLCRLGHATSQPVRTEARRNRAYSPRTVRSVGSLSGRSANVYRSNCSRIAAMPEPLKARAACARLCRQSPISCFGQMTGPKPGGQEDRTRPCRTDSRCPSRRDRHRICRPTR